MMFPPRLADRRCRWTPVAGLPDLWCATLETAYRADGGLMALLHCVRPEESRVSVRIELEFGPVAASWTTEHMVDPWGEDGPACCQAAGEAEFCPPLLEVRPSSWLASFAPGRLPDPPGPEWRHFEIVSSDAIFHVISTGTLDKARFATV